MDTFEFKAIETSIVIGYVILMLIIGLFCRKKAAVSPSSFWAASANVPILVNTFCVLACIMSGGAEQRISLSAKMAFAETAG